MTRAHTYLMAHAGAVLLAVQALTVLAVGCLAAAITQPMVTWGEE